jgi:hypothetical protein
MYVFLSWIGHIERMQGNILLETHFKKTNRKTKDTLGG